MFYKLEAINMLKLFKTRDDFGNVNVANLPIILADKTAQMRRNGKMGYRNSMSL